MGSRASGGSGRMSPDLTNYENKLPSPKYHLPTTLITPLNSNPHILGNHHLRSNPNP